MLFGFRCTVTLYLGFAHSRTLRLEWPTIAFKIGWEAIRPPKLFNLRGYIVRALTPLLALLAIACFFTSWPVVASDHRQWGDERGVVVRKVVVIEIRSLPGNSAVLRLLQHSYVPVPQVFAARGSLVGWMAPEYITDGPLRWACPNMGGVKASVSDVVEVA